VALTGAILEEVLIISPSKLDVRTFLLADYIFPPFLESEFLEIRIPQLIFLRKNYFIKKKINTLFLENVSAWHFGLIFKKYI